MYATSLTDSAPSPELGEKPCAIQRPGASPANETLIAALLCFVRDRREYQPEGPNVKPTHDSGVGSRIQPWGFSPPCHFMYFSVGEGGRAIFPKSLRVFRLLVARFYGMVKGYSSRPDSTGSQWHLTVLSHMATLHLPTWVFPAGQVH